MKKFTLILCLVLFTLTAFSYEDMLISDRIAGRIINPQVDEILVYQISNGVLFLTNATGTPSLNVGKELLSDTEDFSGNWTLAGDFDLATLAFEYNDSAHSGTMTQANADFDDTLIASTWYLLRFSLTDASTPVAATSIVATLGTSAIAVDLDAVGTYYYLIESDAVVTGDDFVITVTTSTAGDITGTMVSLRKVDDAYDVFTNILVSNNLKVKNDLIVEGTITIENATDIHVSNDVLLDDGSIIGITGNEIITFDAAGTIAITGAILEIDDIRDVGNDATLSFSGTNGIDVVNALTMGTGRTDTDFTVGAAASDGIQPIFSIVGDADDDGSVTVSETLALTLTPNANPTLSTWAITSTQSSGYTWDKTISAPYYGSDGTVSNAELLFINSLGSNAQDQLDVRCLESVFGTAIGTGLTLDGTTLKGVTNLSEGTSAETTVDVNSSSGTNATLVSASTIRAGLLTKAKWDEIVVNNGKTGVTDEISNVVEDTDPDLGGDLDVGAFEILLDSTPGTTLTASGTKGVFTNGNAGNVVFGDVCYIAADGDMEFADADAAATMPGVYMALETIATTASGEWLKCGWARDDDGWNWTPGGLIYISVTGTSTNTLTQSVPTGDGDQVQIIGIATHQDRLDFNPNLMLIEINVP